MKNSVMLNRHAELPLNKDKANLFLEIMMAITVFLFAVALSGYFLVDTVVNKWNQNIAGSLTVQIMPSETELTEDEANLRLNKVITFFYNFPNVSKVVLVSEQQMQQLMSPWLGADTDITDLPMPKLLDVYLENENFDYEKTAAELKELAPYASIDDHRIWLHRLLELAASVKTVAVSVLLMILAVCVLSIFYATCTSLGIYKDIIAILHIMGAQDGYIAKQYARRGFVIGLFSGVVGLLLALLSFRFLAYMSADMEQGLIGNLSLTAANWLALCSLPPITACISMATAYYAVTKTLRKIM